MTFHADGATTSWGQDVYVVGDRTELGAWDPARAVKLAPGAYPTWTGRVALPRGAAVQYKFVKKAGGVVTWEGGGNRSFTVPDSASASTGGTWQ